MVGQLITENKLQRKQVVTVSIFCFLSVCFASFTNFKFYNAEYDQDYDRLENVNAAASVVALILLSVATTLLFQYYRFYKYFIKNKVFPLFWKYSNDDIFIINYRGIYNYLSEPPAIIANAKFEGITWNLDNFKDIVEDITKNEASFATFLPTIKYSTKINRVENYIELLAGDTLTLIFFDTYLFKGLFVGINKRTGKQKFSLRFPVPEDVTFEETNFNSFVFDLHQNAKCNIQYLYVNQTIYDSQYSS